VCIKLSSIDFGESFLFLGMMITPQIKEIQERKLVGFSKPTTLLTNAKHTQILFQSLMPQRNSIAQAVKGAYYSLQVYSKNIDFRTFNPQTEYTKWAAIQVNAYTLAHKNLEQMTIPAGMYAVFQFKGSPQTFPQLMQYIHGIWLPNSKYRLNNTPHFELLDDRYSTKNAENEEEVWIPITLKIQ